MSAEDMGKLMGWERLVGAVRVRRRGRSALLGMEDVVRKVDRH